MRSHILLAVMIVLAVLLLPNEQLGARYGNGGMELIKFTTLENSFCRTEIFHEYNKYDEFNKYLSVAFVVFPSFLQQRLGITWNNANFDGRQKKLEIQIVSERTLNGDIRRRFGVRQRVDALYDPMANTIYISKDQDFQTLVHEYFHFLRDVAGVDMDNRLEEALADEFSQLIVEQVDHDSKHVRSFM